MPIINPAEKSLPPLPNSKKRVKTRKAPPPPLSQRCLVTNLRTTEVSGQSQQVQHLRKENKRLHRLLAELQSGQDKNARHIADLEELNRQYHQEAQHQKWLVARIANTISNAFLNYKKSSQLQLNKKVTYNQPITNTKEKRVGYEDVISA